MAKRAAVICGHGNGDPGAVGNGYKEAEVARKIGTTLQAKLKGKVDVYMYDQSKDFYKSKEWAKFTINDEVFEIHLNAASATSANGAEILIKSGYKADSLDNALMSVLAKYFTNRGVKQRSDLGNMNGFASRKISYRLIEVCFITNANDMKVLMNKFDAIVTDMANAIIKALGGSGMASSGGGNTSSGSGSTASTKAVYRVRKTWADSTGQKGAFESLANAKACADKNPGYSVFDANGKSVYTSSAGSSGSSSKEYRVRVTAKDLYIRVSADKNSASKGFIDPGTYTIVEEKNGYGKLKSGAGWISLSYAKKI